MRTCERCGQSVCSGCLVCFNPECELAGADGHDEGCPYEGGLCMYRWQSEMNDGYHVCREEDGHECAHACGSCEATLPVQTGD